VAAKSAILDRRCARQPMIARVGTEGWSRRTKGYANQASVSGGSGVFVRGFNDHRRLVEQNLRLRSISLHDRALPGIGIEALGGITTVPEINASSGLIISVKIVFPYKPRDAGTDEVARAFRDDVARCSNMMSPGSGASLTGRGGPPSRRTIGQINRRSGRVSPQPSPFSNPAGGRHARGPRRRSGHFARPALRASSCSSTPA
jgi:hypothetical protein